MDTDAFDHANQYPSMSMQSQQPHSDSQYGDQQWQTDSPAIQEGVKRVPGKGKGELHEQGFSIKGDG